MLSVQVTTFHISTLSAAQRKAAGQLTAGGSGGTADERDPRRLSNVSTSSNSSSGEAGQPEMLETWIVSRCCDSNVVSCMCDILCSLWLSSTGRLRF
jgi:hypothetical protein